MPKLKIALLSGGISGEREVSLNTGKQIYSALDKNKYEIFQYDPKDNLRQFFIDASDKKFDLVFPALHGPFGEDGKLQGMLDMLNMPYLFSACLPSALAMNKYKTKIIAQNSGLVIANDILLSGDNFSIDNIISKLNLPIVIKPTELGSSVGMSLAKTKEKLIAGIKTAFIHCDNILLEEYIKGRELTCAIMGAGESIKALPIIEIKPKTSDWFDYRAKYEPGATEEVCPAQVPENIAKSVGEYAKDIFKAIGCWDLARADFMWDTSNDKIYFIEINTIPGMTATSLAPQAAQAADMKFSDFLDKLIQGAIKRKL